MSEDHGHGHHAAPFEPFEQRHKRDRDHQGRRHRHEEFGAFSQREGQDYEEADARDQNRLKRGGRAIHVSLSEAMVMPAEKDRELIALNDALTRLEALDERKSKVVELRYFGGLTVEEVAEVLKVSTITVMRDWAFAKAWLSREMQNGK